MDVLECHIFCEVQENENANSMSGDLVEPDSTQQNALDQPLELRINLFNICNNSIDCPSASGSDSGDGFFERVYKKIKNWLGNLGGSGGINDNDPFFLLGSGDLGAGGKTNVKADPNNNGGSSTERHLRILKARYMLKSCSPGEYICDVDPHSGGNEDLSDPDAYEYCEEWLDHLSNCLALDDTNLTEDAKQLEEDKWSMWIVHSP